MDRADQTKSMADFVLSTLNRGRNAIFSSNRHDCFSNLSEVSPVAVIVSRKSKNARYVKCGLYSDESLFGSNGRLPLWAAELSANKAGGVIFFELNSQASSERKNKMADLVVSNQIGNIKIPSGWFLVLDTDEETADNVKSKETENSKILIKKF